MMHGRMLAVVLLAGCCGGAAVAATLQGQTASRTGAVTAIAVCFGTLSPPAGWSTAEATANTLAKSNQRIVAVLPAQAPAGCANPQILWAQAP
jgi:cytochrome c556